MKTGKPLGQGFRALFVGSLVSNTGDGIRLVALPLLAAGLTSSPLLISAVTAAQYLAWITFAPVGGALVDRWDRRRTILVTQTWRGVVVGILAVLVWIEHAEIWQLCLVAFSITLGEILVDPSTVALVPTLVDGADLDRANGRISSVEIVTNDFAGGPVGAALFSVAPWLPFAVDGSTYLGSVIPFARLPRSQSPPRGMDRASRQSIGVDAVEGFRWLRTHEVLGLLTVAHVVFYFGFAASLSLLVVLVTERLGASDAAFGIVVAVGATGALVGALVAARIADRFGSRVVLTGAVVLQAVTLAAAAFADSVSALTVIWFLNGIPAGVHRPISRGIQQRLTPNRLLGRVNVTSRIFTRGIIAVGALVAGGLATRSGVGVSFVVGGLVQLVAAAMIWFALRPRAPSTETEVMPHRRR